MVKRVHVGPAFAFLLMGLASVLTPCRTQCHVVTIFGLKTADCNKQNVKVIPRTLDRDLQVVRFDDNRLVRLDSDEFRIYPNLQEIYLARNHIESISKKAFHGLFSLQILDLEGNQLTSVPSDSFQVIASLRMLSLKGNPIRRIEMGALTNLRNVEELNFENCWLDAIDPLAFHSLEKLVEINLVNNELQGLEPDMASSLPTSLSILRLYRNPWTCNCRLRWLRKWISVPGSVNWDFATNTPACAAPELIKGIAWKHLSPDQFACPTRIVFNATRTSATVEEGRNVTLECLAIGDPEPSVSWIRDGGKAMPRGTLFTENRHTTESGERLVASAVTMLRVGPDQAGDYRCSAENSAGRSEMTYKVLVQEFGASVVGSGRVDADREMLLGVLVGIGVLVVVVVIVTVHRVKFRQRQMKRGYDGDIYTKNLTPLTKKKDTTEEEEVDSEEEEDDEQQEEERDDSSLADSFTYQVKSTGNAKTDSTLQSLLGGRKGNGVDILPSRVEGFSGNEPKAQAHQRRQTERKKNQPEEDEEYEEITKSCKLSAGRSQRRPSGGFSEMSPSSSASDKSDRSSPRTDSENDKFKSIPDLLSEGGSREGGCAGKILQGTTSRPRVTSQQVSRSGRSVSFCATPQQAHANDETSDRFSIHKEASSSAETLVLDDVTRRILTADVLSKAKELRPEENVPISLTSSGHLSPTPVRFATIDRSKLGEKTPGGSPGRDALTSNTVHFPEHSSSQDDTIKSSNSGAIDGNSGSLGKSCLRKKSHHELSPNDDIQIASGTCGRKFAHVTPETERPNTDASRRKEGHQRLLPRIPPSAVSFRQGSPKVTSETVENGLIRDCPRVSDGPYRGLIPRSIEGSSIRGSQAMIGGFMNDSLRCVEGSRQRMVDVGLTGTPNSCHSIERRSPFYSHQNSTLAANSTISPSFTYHDASRLRRETNRTLPTRPFDTLPSMPCANRGQRSSRPDSSIVDFDASGMVSSQNSCLHQKHNQVPKSKKHPHPITQQQQQQQHQHQQSHHVTLLSDILLPPFGKVSVASSSDANDFRTRADNRRNIGLDDEDDAGTPL